MELIVAGRQLDIKFNYQLMYKISRQLGTKSEKDGQPNNDGVGALFYQVMERQDQALVDLIRLSWPSGKKAVSEDEIVEAIANHVAEDGSTEGLFKAIEEEMIASGFFKEKISKYIATMEKTVGYLKLQEEKDELQLKIMEDMIGRMATALS